MSRGSLIVTRRKDESITLQTAHGDIVVSIPKISETKIKLQIEAPDEVGIVRSELLEPASN